MKKNETTRTSLTLSTHVRSIKKVDITENQLISTNEMSSSQRIQRKRKSESEQN